MATTGNQLRSAARRWGLHVLLLLALAVGGLLLKNEVDREPKTGWIDLSDMVPFLYWGSLGTFAVLSTLLRWRGLGLVGAYLVPLVLSPGAFVSLGVVFEGIRQFPEDRREEKIGAAARDSMHLERWWQRIDRSAGRVEVGAMVRAQRDCSLRFNSELGLGAPSAAPSDVRAAHPLERPAAEPIRAGETRSFTEEFSIAAEDEVRDTILYLDCDSASLMFNSETNKEDRLDRESYALPLPPPTP